MSGVPIRGKHRRQGHVQDLADVEQAHGADAIGALFIILNLLKRDPQGPGKLLLAQIERQAALADANADIFVDFRFCSCLHFSTWCSGVNGTSVMSPQWPDPVWVPFVEQ